MITEDAHKGICVYEETIATRDKPRLIDATALVKRLKEKRPPSGVGPTSFHTGYHHAEKVVERFINEMLAAKQEKADE